MFVHAEVTARVGAGGAVLGDALTDKWVSPMYPEVVENGPGICRLSGLPLVPAKSLGYATTTAPSPEVLAIPSSAVLRTGHRAIVYVELADNDGDVRYEGREVELGPRAGDHYVVLAGLSEGDRVVTQGALQIDSALQIQAKPCMMDALAKEAGTAAPAASAPSQSRAIPGAAYHTPMHAVIDKYLAFTAALVAAEDDAATQAIADLKQALRAAEPRDLPDADAGVFRRQVAAIAAALPAADKTDLEARRATLPAMTKALDDYLLTFGHDRPEPLVRIHCPMAFNDRGADWYHSDNSVRNPYFGSRMLRCGTPKAAVAADGREVH
jgi:Cu(I)/Ag(I) efflux system membrane fusion protein